MNHIQLIKNASLFFSLKTIGEGIFNAWHENVCQQMPQEIEIDKPTTSVLEIDLLENTATALASVASNQENGKISDLDTAYTFFSTYLQNSLNALWVNRHLVEPSQAFYDLMKLKSVLEMLSLDEEFKKKIDLVYDYLMDHKEDAMSKEENLPSNVISLVQKQSLNASPPLKYHDEFVAYFESLFFNEYLALLREFEGMYCPDTSEHLSREMFEEIYIKISPKDV